MAKPMSLTTWKPKPHSSDTFSPDTATLALANARIIGAPAAINAPIASLTISFGSFQ